MTATLLRAFADSTNTTAYNIGAMTTAPTPGRVQFAAVTSASEVTGATSITGWAGATWSAVAGAFKTFGGARARTVGLWRLTAGSPSSAALTVTFPNSRNGCIVIVFEVDAVDAADPIRALAIASSETVNVTSGGPTGLPAEAGNQTVVVYMLGEINSNTTPAAGWSRVGGGATDPSHGAPPNTLSVHHHASPQASGSASWPSSNYAAIGVELRAASSAPVLESTGTAPATATAPSSTASTRTTTDTAEADAVATSSSASTRTTTGTALAAALAAAATATTRTTAGAGRADAAATSSTLTSRVTAAAARAIATATAVTSSTVAGAVKSAGTALAVARAAAATTSTRRTATSAGADADATSATSTTRATTAAARALARVAGATATTRLTAGLARAIAYARAIATGGDVGPVRRLSAVRIAPRFTAHRLEPRYTAEPTDPRFTAERMDPMQTLFADDPDVHARFRVKDADGGLNEYAPAVVLVKSGAARTAVWIGDPSPERILQVDLAGLEANVGHPLRLVNPEGNDVPLDPAPYLRG